MSSVANALRTARAGALYGFAAGFVLAAVELFPRRHVLEFQAGPEAGVVEKLSAVAQRAAMEGVGFAALGLILGLAAAGVSRVSRLPFGAVLVPIVGAFAAWIWKGAWLGNELLPFLPVGKVLLLDLAGIAAISAGLLVLGAVAKRLPGGRAADPVVVAGAVLVVTGVAAWAGMELARGSSAGWRAPRTLAVAALPFLAVAPVAVVLARALAPAGRTLVRGVAALATPPVMLRRGLLIGLALCAALAAKTASTTVASKEVRYPRRESHTAPDAPNIVYVVIDTLRADHLGCYGYERDTSPFLDSLAAEGALFLDTTSPSAWTKPSTATLLTGLYPSRHGAIYHGSRLGLPEDHLTLAETFRRSGYVTAGFVSNPNVKAIFDFDEGFDVFFDSPVEDTTTLACLRESTIGGILKDLTRYQFNWKYENDVRSINQHVFNWLEQGYDQRFFLYVHYIDPHEPYEPPADYARRFAGDHEGLLLHNRRKELVGQDLYDAEIRYSDDGLSELVAELRRHGVFENTLFVLTSDHGEEWYEHGFLGHGFSLYQGVLGIPLVMRGPGVPVGARIDTPVQVLDLPATVLELAGLDVTEFGDGRSFASLFDPTAEREERPIFLENEFGEDEHDLRSFVLTGMRLGPLKLVLTEESAYRPPGDPNYPPRELYDLSIDPDELRNLFEDPDYEDAVRAMLVQLTEHAAFLQSTGLRTEGPPVMSDDVRAQLEAMGYL